MKTNFKTTALVTLLCILGCSNYLKSQGLLDSLKACYPMDCNANNYGPTGSAYNGTIFGNVTCTSGHTGASNKALQFGGTSVDYVSLPNLPGVKPSNQLTIAGWFNVSSGSNQVLVYANNGCGSNFDAYSLTWNGSNTFTGYKRPGLTGCGAGVSISSSAVSPGWHFVVWYISNTALKLSIDNGAYTTVSHTVPFNYNASTGVILGGTNQSVNAPFNGKIDNLRFYTRPLSVSEVSDLYNNDVDCLASSGDCAPSTPYAEWLFSNNLNDKISGTPGTWNPSGSPTYVNDRCGNANSAIQFNGINNYINANITVNSTLLDSSARSVSFWMKTNNTACCGVPNVKTVFNYGMYTTGTMGSRWEICQNYFGSQGLGVDISLEVKGHCTACVNDDTWHHVVVTQGLADTLGQAKFYLDGQAIPNPWAGGCNYNTANSTNHTKLNPVTIGAVLVGTTAQRFFSGSLDDIYLYNRVLNPAEVKTLFNCKCPGIIVGKDSVCMGSAHSYSFTNFQAGYHWSFSPGAPAGWALGSPNTSNPINVTSANGTAYLVLLNNCGVRLDSTLMTGYDCCRIPASGYTLLKPKGGTINGTYSNNSYLVTNDITLSSNTAFQNAEFIMAPNVKIIVPNGKVLTIDHSHLYACKDSLWTGIVVQDGGQVISLNQRKGATLIEDAKVGIDVDIITTSHATPPVQLEEVIFNKNYEGIKFSNSTPAVTSLPVQIISCVFTSRALPYSTPAPFTTSSWPNADASSGLRFQNLSTSGLAAPYLLGSYSQANIKTNPYGSQPGHIGIKIDHIGDQAANTPATGVDIGYTYFTGNGQYNLFDALGEGIDVHNANLLTMNNVFQNMRQYTTQSGILFGGTGVNAVVDTIMNAQLVLTPQGTGNQNVNFSNRFWDNIRDVNTKNVYGVDIRYCTFRSQKNMSPTPALGKFGIKMASNRFKYHINSNEFNNLDTAIVSYAIAGPYNMGNGNSSSNGTYADSTYFNQNYFGPEVNSSTSILMEYLNHALIMDGSSATNWVKPGACEVYSNKIDRSYRGILTTQMNNYPIEIGGNLINIIDDIMCAPSSIQYGIFGDGSTGNLVIKADTVSSNNTTNTRMALIRARNNSGTNSPVIINNKVSNAYTGFWFDGNQPNTVWGCNRMYTPMTYGLYLTSGTIIGNQTSTNTDSGNRFMGTGWGVSGNNQTYCDANPGLSIIYGVIPAPVSHVGSSPYNTPLTYKNVTSSTDCISPNTYPVHPAQRSVATSIGAETGVTSLNVDVYPNPSNGDISIKADKSNSYFNCLVTDITGKVVFEKKIVAIGGEANLHLPLETGIYMIQLSSGDNKVSRKKLVIE